MNYGKLILKLIEEEKSQLLYGDTKQKFFLLQHKEEELQFQIKFKEVDKSGIVIDYLSIHHKTPILDLELLNKKLDQQANTIQERITFLLEDFKLIEMDNQNKRAQLRSYPPYRNADSKYYYEIVLDEGIKAHFQRYEYSMNEKRYEKITSQLTKETFERLINELSQLFN